MQDLMIDFETLGQDPDTAVISLGACFFDENTGEIGPTFYMAFDIDSQLKKGRTITADTLKWWMGQSGAAKKVFNEKAKPAEEVLALFFQWCKANCSKKSLRPWGNGSTFDISIIEDLLKMYNIDCPWMFYNVMDLRTFRRYVANSAKVNKSEGVNHNALDDATNQAKFVIEHFKFFKDMLAAFQQLSEQTQANMGTPDPNVAG